MRTRAPALEHLQSLSRAVAIISASIFVFLCTNFYSTLLLSIISMRHQLSTCWEIVIAKLFLKPQKQNVLNAVSQIWNYSRLNFIFHITKNVIFVSTAECNYGWCLLCRLVVKQTVMPLSMETLLKALESNQLTIMFSSRGDLPEYALRNTNGELARFGKAMDKHPPMYGSDYPNTHSWAALSG